MKSISKQRSVNDANKARRNSIQRQILNTHSLPEVFQETQVKLKESEKAEFSDSWVSNQSSMDRFHKDQKSNRKTYKELKDVQGEIILN